MPTSLYTTTGLLEAPLVGADGSVLFADVTGGGVYRYREQGTETVLAARRGIGGLAWHAGGGVVMTGRDLSYIGTDSVTRQLLTLDGATGFNDLTVAADGALYAGVLRHQPQRGEPAGPSEVIRIGPAGDVSIAAENIRWPNGLGFAPDGQALYVCEYAESRILLIDNGDRHAFATAPSGECDGLAVDAEGGVWVALGTGSTVARFTPDGQLDTTINLPDGFVSSVAFHGTTLLITTAGRLLSHPVGITGTPIPATSIPLP
ncbi:SMP-30/gluconolactonase/LRE family protein [Nocardia sp. NPDC051052]|uniref:SMP-30/gluconolactonase/LRE family protein n=1 Tax=Nocardia sp. NPDC051052 TaxID=3364322 RepID=UPI0037953006